MSTVSTFPTGTLKSFTDLNTWKKGHELILMIYETTKSFPSEERFALVDQIRRAAVSITSNIAEGFSRTSYREKTQFYATAMGSLTEVQNQLFIARDIQYISAEQFRRLDEQSIIVSKLLSGLIKNSKTKIQDSKFKIQK